MKVFSIYIASFVWPADPSLRDAGWRVLVSPVKTWYVLFDWSHHRYPWYALPYDDGGVYRLDLRVLLGFTVFLSLLLLGIVVARRRMSRLWIPIAVLGPGVMGVPLFDALSDPGRGYGVPMLILAIGILAVGIAATFPLSWQCIRPDLVHVRPCHASKRP